MDVLQAPVIKQKKRIGRTPKYTEEYYMMMAKHIVDENLSFREAAKIYKVSHGTVNHWLKLYKSGKLPQRIKKAKLQVESQDSLIQRMDRYIRELKAEVGELYLENQMLKKAQQLSRQIKNERSSVITSENLAQWQKDAK